VDIQCAVRPAELRASVCSKLRHRYGVVAVPSPFASSEILVLGEKKLPVDQFATNHGGLTFTMSART